MSQLNEYYEHGRAYERWIAEQRAQDIVPKLINAVIAIVVIGASVAVGYSLPHPGHH